jgi:zona occludens toxin
MDVDLEDLGEIVQVSNDDIISPDFFPKEGKNNSNCIVRSGDIVGLDECWRWYVAGIPLNNDHMTFFRMHRHFVSEKGVACDIVLIVQAIQDLQRKVLAVVEKSYRMRKHKDLGMSDRYVVSVYLGNRQVGGALIESYQLTYQPEIFALYSSYSQSQSVVGARELQVDKRGNLFNRTLIKVGIPLSILMIIAAFLYVYRFFHPKKPVQEKSEQTIPDKADNPRMPDKPLPQVTPKPADDGVSDKWRLVGLVGQGGLTTFALEDSSRRIRFISNPPAYKQSPGEIELKLPNGDIVTRWSGSPVTLSGVPRARESQSFGVGVPHD